MIGSPLAPGLVLVGLVFLPGCDGHRTEIKDESWATPPPSPSNPPPPEDASQATLAQVDLSQVCVESGRIDPGEGGKLSLRTAGVRAVCANTLGAAVDIAFTYRGPSKETAPLASGELRRQIGLKLRAQDTCNLVYVTWHVAPTTGIHVSVKLNPGQKTHAECADRGYRNVLPTSKRDVAPIQVGERHTLAARIDGSTLRVAVDGAPAWEGTLPPEAFTIDGPVGIRSDNGEFDVELRAAPGKGHACPPR
jgi:hypothetical protein